MRRGKAEKPYMRRRGDEKTQVDIHKLRMNRNIANKRTKRGLERKETPKQAVKQDENGTKSDEGTSEAR